MFWNVFIGFQDEDMGRIFQLPKTTRIGGDIDTLPLGEIIQRLRNIYCNHIGLEYMHIHDRQQCKWHIYLKNIKTN